MGWNTIWRALLIIALVICGGHYSNALIAQERQPLSIETNVDWINGELFITLREDINTEARGERRIAASHYALQRWRPHLPQILLHTFDTIALQADESVAERIRNNRQNLSLLTALSDRGRLIDTGVNTAISQAHAQYKFSLYPTIASLFVLHAAPDPVAQSYSWVASDDFTGIVIIAQGDLPIRGTSALGRARPALQPKIYDEQLRLIAAPRMVDPAILRNRGMAGYDNRYAALEWRSRIGDNPLRTIARGLLGSDGHDIIIDDRSADQIISRHTNRALIQQGRMLLVVDRTTEQNSTTLVLQ